MWKIINHGNGVDIYVGGVRCYIAPNAIVETDNAEVVEAARKVSSLRITEIFDNLTVGKLRELASQRGLKNCSKLTKKKLIDKLSEVKIDEFTKSS